VFSITHLEKTTPEAGNIVHVRQRLYLVEDVQAPPNAGDATLISLSCVEDDAQGQPLDVLWEHELDAEIRSAENWGRLAERGFDPMWSKYLRDGSEFMMDVPHAREQSGSAVGVRHRAGQSETPAPE
jgi:hypothetical protein